MLIESGIDLGSHLCRHMLLLLKRILLFPLRPISGSTFQSQTRCRHPDNDFLLVREWSEMFAIYFASPFRVPLFRPGDMRTY